MMFFYWYNVEIIHNDGCAIHNDSDAFTSGHTRNGVCSVIFLEKMQKYCSLAIINLKMMTNIA
jgi:hypothetical protein